MAPDSWPLPERRVVKAFTVRIFPGAFSVAKRFGFKVRTY
jgi:hypothetical protein